MTTFNGTPVSTPLSATLATLIVSCLDQFGAPKAGVEVLCKIHEMGGTGYAYDGANQTATSDVNGQAVLTVVKGATYLLRRGGPKPWKEMVVGQADIQYITSIIGIDAA